MSILDIFKGDEVEQDIKNENKQMKKKIKNFKAAYNEVNQEKEELSQKYIALLEEKGAGFNQYIYYQNKCNEISNELKETGKQISVLKGDFKGFKNIISVFSNKLVKVAPVASKCKNLDDIMFVLLIHYCNDKDLPLKSIQNACKRCKVTKEKIKKSSNFLYEVFNIEKWEI